MSLAGSTVGASVANVASAVGLGGALRHARPCAVPSHLRRERSALASVALAGRRHCAGAAVGDFRAGWPQDGAVVDTGASNVAAELELERIETLKRQESAFISKLLGLGKSPSQERLQALIREAESADDRAVTRWIAALSRAGHADAAVAVLRSWCDLGRAPNTIHFGAAVSACASAGRWASALGLLSEMTERFVEKNAKVFNSAITACERGRHWRIALGFLDGMRDVRILPNTITYNACISACEKGRQWEAAMQVLGDMSQRGVRRNTITYNSAISACEKGTQWPVAIALLADMEARAVPKDVITFSAAISACEKSGHWSLALYFLRHMAAEQLQPSNISYCASMSACEKGTQWMRSLELYSEMKARGVLENTISCGAAISACEKGSRWLGALGLLGDMRSRGIERNTIVYNAAICACARADRPSAALGLFADMLQQERLACDTVVYNSVLDAVYAEPCAQALFQQALSEGCYAGLLEKGSALLDVHDLSPGAATLAVRWWLSSVLPHCLQRQLSNGKSGVAAEELLPESVEIITGWGKSRKAWDTTNVKTTVIELLDELGVVWYQPINDGRIGIRVAQLLSQDASRLAPAAASAGGSGSRV